MFGIGYQEVLLLLVIFGLVGGVIYSAKLARKRTATLGGIAGWLVLVGFGVVITPLFLLWQVYAEMYPALLETNWRGMNQKQIAITVLLQGVIFALWLCLVAWAIYNVVLFFRRRRRFPKSWVWLNGLFLVLAVVVAIFDADSRQGIGALFFWSAVWIAYMLRSQRVKNTFVD
jgi:hypothetical protein